MLFVLRPVNQRLRNRLIPVRAVYGRAKRCPAVDQLEAELTADRRELIGVDTSLRAVDGRRDDVALSEMHEDGDQVREALVQCGHVRVGRPHEVGPQGIEHGVADLVGDDVARQ